MMTVQSSMFLITWGRYLFKQTRTRILLIYLALMCTCAGAAVPLFRALLFSNIDARVTQDLRAQAKLFVAAYDQWQLDTSDQTLQTFKGFVNDFLIEERPEDDNFFLFYLDGQLYRAQPFGLPSEVFQNDDLLDQWFSAQEYTTGERESGDPNIGNILYKIQPIEINGIRRGVFVATHLTAGERQEALIGVYLFAKMALGVIFIAFIFAWILTGQLLKPVKALANTARAIGESDLSQRIKPPSGSGELAELSVAFNNMMNRLQMAFNSQRDFINDAGHELRTPITIVQGHLELMGQDPDEQQETIELVMDELDRMGRMVNDLITLAKSERSDFLQLETIEMSTFVTTLFSKAQTLGERSWLLNVQSQGKLVADRQRLTGALLNLLHNAAQHTHENDVIELGCLRQGKQVKFWVRDTGEGIEDADQDHIFERFARVSHRFRQSDGSGLGLAIVRAIATAHGGHIQLNSRLGQGSTFTLILPLDPPQEAALQEAKTG